jgi:hypothetical protein
MIPTLQIKDTEKLIGLKTRSNNLLFTRNTSPRQQYTQTKSETMGNNVPNR